MDVKLDDLISKLGSPGRYQIMIFLLLCLNYFPLVYSHVIMAFLGLRPIHQCHSKAFYNSTGNSKVNFDETFVNYDFEKDNVTMEIGKCSATYRFPTGRNMSVTCPDDDDSVLIYQQSPKRSNIVTEWNLVCDKSSFAALATTIYFCGVMLGGVLFGYLADKFGRKPIMLTTLYLPILVGIATAFAPWYSLFVGLRFLQGILMQGLQTTTFILVMELFEPKYRSYAGAVLENFWSLSVMTIPLLVYLIPNWHHLQLVISLPSTVVIFYICVMPESLRWMIMTNKNEKAEALMTKVTTWNKLPFPREEWDKVQLRLDIKDQVTRQYNFIDMLRTPKLRKRSLILFYIWFSISLGYYGLTFTLTSFPGNKYLIFFIAGAAEFVAHALVIYITPRFGRKKPLLTYFLLATIFMIGAGVILATNTHVVYLSSGLAIAGKFAMGGLFSVIFLYTSELYPTVIRNIGLGSCTFWTRFGGVVAPQIINLDAYGNKAIPMIIFGAVVLIGGLLTLMLPETLGCKLPDTIEDAEKISDNINSNDIASKNGEQIEM